MEQNVINFETEWTIAEDNTTVTVPVTGTVDVYIDYGDGTKENITKANPTHTYAAGTYVMKLSGKCTDFTFNTSTRDYLTELKKWGCLENKTYTFGGYINGSYTGCTNMKGSIPSPHNKSFKNGGIFNYTFYNCIGLTGSIPEGLFSNCPNVISFTSTFDHCSGLTGSIPEQLFANCLNVSSFCYSSRGNYGKGQGAFSGCRSLTGSAPELWNRTNVTNHYYCFYGCTQLDNYADIPDDWK